MSHGTANGVCLGERTQGTEQEEKLDQGLREGVPTSLPPQLDSPQTNRDPGGPAETALQRTHTSLTLSFHFHIFLGKAVNTEPRRDPPSFSHHVSRVLYRRLPRCAPRPAIGPTQLRGSLQ